MRKILNTFSSKARGFTLIELLVVIAIIGILASIVLVSLNSARGKGRDAQRVANLQEMAKALSLVDPDTTALSGGACAGTGPANVTACSGPAPVNFSAYADPSVGSGGTLCTNGSSATCQYFITGLGKALAGNNYQICTYLENGLSIGGAAGVAGMYSVSTSTGGSVAKACY